MGRITNYDKKVWNTYKQALTPKLSVTRGTGVASVSISDGLKSFANGDLITIGNTYTVTATPSPGYAHSALLINGVVKTNPARVVITDNQFSVVAQASDVMFNLAVTGDNATVSVVDGEITYEPGSDILPLGAEVVITATNSVGYEVTALTVNGEAFTSGESIVITGNLAIAVTTSELSHDLTITKDANCTVTVMYGENELVAGEDIIPNSAELVITATADSGYSIASLTVNGTAFTSGESIVATDDIAIVVTVADILFDLSTTLTGCTLVISDGFDTYEAGSNVIPKDTELTITATASEGYTLEGMTFTINGNAFTNGGTHTVIDNVDIVATAIKVWTLDIEATGCTLVVSDGTNTYSDGDMIADGTVITLTPTPSDGYTLDGMTFTINATPYTSGANYTVVSSVGVVATAVEVASDTLVGEIDFNIDSTWDSEDEIYVVNTPPTIDFSGLTDGDVNIKITYTIDGNTTTVIGTKLNNEDSFLCISSLFSGGAIDLGGGLAIVVADGLGENTDMIYLVATENYLLTHTVVLNSIEIDENITEILSADIDYVYDSVDTYDGTITTQTIDTTGLINEQSNIKTYWDIDDTRYIVNAMAIIAGTTTSFQQSTVTDTLTIKPGVLAKIIDTDGVITTEITGLAGTEVVTLLSIFVDENV